MFDEWKDVIARCAFDEKIRVLVVTGEGRAFSSGVDLTVLGSDNLQPPAFRFYYRQAHQAFDDLETLEVPVIAAINGLCYGGGVELALSCDIVLASENATFCLVENQLGAIPASGACNRMIHHVGLAKTKELIITADPIHAAEARRIGLISQVYKHDEFMDRVYTYAERLLKNSPLRHGHGETRGQYVRQHRHAYRARHRTAGAIRSGAVRAITRKGWPRFSKSATRTSREVVITEVSREPRL